MPFELDFDGRPQLLARFAGAGGGRSLLLNGHIDVVSGEPKARWTDDPNTPVVRDGNALRARRVRHEGRRRGDGAGRRDARAARRPPRRRPAREHDHRRGVDGRRRHRERRPRRARRRRHRARADGLRGLDRLPRLGLPDDHGRGPARPRRAAAAALARRRRRQRDREGADRARRDPRAARGVAHALRPAAPLPLAARHRAHRHARPASGRSPTRPRARSRAPCSSRPRSPTPTATARACDGRGQRVDRARLRRRPVARRAPAGFSWAADIPPMEIPPDDPIVQTVLAASADVGEPSRLGGLDSWYDGATYTLVGRHAVGRASARARSPGRTRSTSTCPSTTSCAARRPSRSPPCASAGRHEHAHHARRPARPGHAGPRSRVDARGSADRARAPPGGRPRRARRRGCAARRRASSRARSCARSRPRRRPPRRSGCRSRPIRAWPSSPRRCPRPGRSPRPTS